MADAQASQSRTQVLVDRAAAALFYLATTVAVGAMIALAFAGVSVPPAAAALAMSISTVVVAANAQLLRRLALRPEPLPEIDLREAVRTTVS